MLIGPCTIGSGVTVAAGAVVRNVQVRFLIKADKISFCKVKGDFPDNVVIGGVPAKILKHLDPPPPATKEDEEKFPKSLVP